MSRGFVKEDDQEEAPFIPPRAPLPPGVVNYVTPTGLKALLVERSLLGSERGGIVGTDAEGRRARAVIDGRLALLNERISTARLVEPSAEHEDVRFGSTVTFTHTDGPNAGTRRTLTIVGVDEASVKEHRIAFTAPIARALIGKRCGEMAHFTLGSNATHLRIDHIDTHGSDPVRP